MKKNIVFFMLVAIMFTSIGVYAGTRISAADIDYNDTTVEAAINDLYLEAYKNITFATSLYNQSQGEKIANRSTSLTLSNGDYIVIALSNFGSAATSKNTSVAASTQTISCNNGCTKQKIAGRDYKGFAKDMINSTSYLNGHLDISVFYVKVNSASDTITSVSSNANYSNTKLGETVALQAIPIEY